MNGSGIWKATGPCYIYTLEPLSMISNIVDILVSLPHPDPRSSALVVEWIRPALRLQSAFPRGRVTRQGEQRQTRGLMGADGAPASTPPATPEPERGTWICTVRKVSVSSYC